MNMALFHVALEFDPRLLSRLNRHIDNLIAELRVIASGIKTDNHELPVSKDVAELIPGIVTQYSEVHETNRRRAEEAIGRGEAKFVLEMDLPAVAATASRALQSALERADDYCRDRVLLTLPMEPEVAEFRRWYMEEIARQVDGSAKV